jgi:hypothetical protein
MSEERPNYYAVIPANVRYDKELKPNEKLLYGEISALAQKEGYCWASNTYFAELYDVYPTTISKWLKHLEQLGYITIKMVYKNGSNEIEKRLIGIAQNDNTYCSKEQEGYCSFVQGGIAQKSKDNNININNININKRESKERKSARPSLNDIEVYVKEKGLLVNPKQFFDYFEAGNWRDAKGQEVKNWKQKILTWNKFEQKENKAESKDDHEKMWEELAEANKDWKG